METINETENTGNNKSLFEIKSDLLELATYLESSKAFYKTLGVDLEQSFYNSDTKELTFTAIVPKEMQGYENILHGGTVSALLDAASGVVGLIESSKNGDKVVTAEMSVKYLKPLQPGESYICVGKVLEENSRLMQTSGLITGVDDVEYANAVAKLVVLKNKK